jgi:hypothetical protein
LENARDTLTRLGLYYPSDKSLAVILSYIKDHAGDSETFFNRPIGMEDPPELIGLGEEKVRDTIKYYTDFELRQFYNISDDRLFGRQLLKYIVDNSKERFWSTENNRCNNDDLLDVVNVEPRGNMEKNDKENPFVSFGGLKDRACYSLEELFFSFREIDDIFRFSNPDNIPKQNPVPDFPISSMKTLREIISSLQKYNKISGNIGKELITKIDIGLKLVDESKILANALTKEYLSKTPDEQVIIRDYLIWLFLFGMYNRYWEGPGHEWPHQWNDTRETCTTVKRDFNVQQFAIPSFNDFIDNLVKTNGPLADWIIRLKRVKYDWTSGQALIPRYTGDITIPLGQRLDLLYGIVTQTLNNNYCQADASDATTQSSFFYLTKILGYTLEQFNQFIEGYLRVKQEPFNPSKFTTTGHIEPGTKGIKFE